MRKIKFCLIFFIIHFTKLHSQFIGLKHYNENDGLYSTAIKQVVFDRHNVMWLISDRNKLWKFDSRKFEEINLLIGSESDRRIIKDNLGNLWILENDLRKRELLITRLPLIESKNIDWNYKFGFTGNIENVVILIKNQNPYVYLKDKDLLKAYLLEPNRQNLFATKPFKNLLKLDLYHSSLLVVCKDEIKIIEPKQQGFEETKSIVVEDEIVNETPVKEGIIVCENRTMYLYTQNFTLKSSLNRENKIPLSNKDLSQYKIYKGNRKIYFYNIFELVAFDPVSGVSEVLNINNGFITTGVFCIEEDMEGNTWFAHSKGITKLPSASIEKIQPFDQKLSYELKEISSLYWFDESKGKLFAGSNTALCIFDYFSGKTEYFKAIDFKSDERDKYRVIDAVLVKDKLYYVFKGVGIGVITCENGIYKDQLLSGLTMAQNGYMFTICKIGSSQLVIGGAGKIIYYDCEKNIETDSLNIKKYGTIRKIFQRKNKNLLVLGVNGIFEIDSKTKQIKIINSEKSFYSYVYNTQNKNEYLASSEGLFEFKNNIPIKIDYGYPNSVFGLIVDNKGNLWLGLDNGVVRYNPFTRETVQFRSPDGFLGTEVNRSAMVFGFEEQKVFIGTNLGLNVIKAIQADYKKHLPFYISGIYSNDKTADGTTSFPYGSKILIKLGFCSYSDNTSLKYCYKLNNEELWVELESPEINFAYLSPGSHQVELRVKNGSSFVSDPLKLSFTILTPWWQKWWFYLLLGLAAVLMLSFLFYLRIRKIKKEVTKENYIINLKRQVLESQMALLRSQINPHFVNNLLNRIRYYFSKDHRNLDTAFDLITNYAHLMRYSFDNTENDFVLLKDEIEFYKQYMSIEGNLNKIEFELEIDEKIPVDEILIPGMLIQPLIENACKHAFNTVMTNKTIKLSVQRLDDALNICVTDNGIGFYKGEFQKRNSGITLTERRIKYYNNLNMGKFSMRVDTESNQGTSIKLEIPVISRNQI